MILLLGDRTYEGLGDYIKTNHAAGLVRELARAFSDMDSRVTFMLTVFEVPPTKKNKPLRDLYTLMVIQALLSEETTLSLNVERPNLSQNMNLGLFRTVHSKLWFPDESVNVSACAALLAMPHLDAMLNDVIESNRPIITVQSSPKEKNKKHDAVISFVGHPGQPRPANILDMLSVEFDPQTTIEVKQTASEKGQTLQVLLMAMKPKSSESYVARMQWLRAVKATLTALKVDLTKVATTKKNAAAQQLKDATSIVNSRWPVGIHFGSMNPIKAKQKLVLLLPQVAKAQQALAEAQGNLDAIESAIQTVDGQLKDYQETLTVMRKWTENLSVENGAKGDIFTSDGIARAFPLMVKAVERESTTAFQTAIVGVISSVSMKGLALVTGASEAPIAILHAIADGKPSVECPFPGAKVREDSNHRTVMVLPNLGDADFNALQAAAGTEKMDDISLSRVSLVDGAICVNLLRVYNILTIEDIWPDSLYKTHKELENEPMKSEVTLLKGAPGIKELEGKLTELKCERKQRKS